jgi:hypothetical protein
MANAPVMAAAVILVPNEVTFSWPGLGGPAIIFRTYMHLLE